jgi:hypothetical protein
MTTAETATIQQKAEHSARRTPLAGEPCRSGGGAKEIDILLMAEVPSKRGLP